MSLTPAGADPAPVSPPGVDRSTSNNLWWVVKLKNGTVGITRGNMPPLAAVNSEPIAHANSLGDLFARYSSTVFKALADMGVSAAQRASIVGESDVGAAQDATTNWLYVDSAGRPTAGTGAPGSASQRVSTASRGDATPINQIPSPIPATAGNSNLGTQLGGLFSGVQGVAIRVLEAVGALLLLVLGLRALLGGESPTVTLARAARRIK